MKFYLSSYKFGNNPEQLSKLFGNNKRVGLITNAIDFSTDFLRRENSEKEQIEILSKLGLEPEVLDLRKYFASKNELPIKLEELGGVWVYGGNTFLLRVAYKLSGFDEIIKSYIEDSIKSEFVYGGFSAGGCVLQKDLKGVSFVDEPHMTKNIYNEEPMWEGLGIIDFAFVPHFKSDHPESDDTNKSVEYYQKNNINYRTVSDGEVIILNA